MATSDKSFNGELLESIFKTSKKTIQEYVREIERNNRYRSCRQDISSGYILDDRARLIDLYEACLQQDAHIRSVVETLESQILGDRYMLARVNEKGKYIKDVANSLKIQGSQFDKIIKGIVESKLYGYTLLEIMPHTDPRTGRLAEVNIIERRNVLPDQKTVLKRQGLWEPHWDLHDPAYYRCYVLVNSGDLGLFSATTPLILAKKFTVANYVNFSHTYGQPIIHGKTVSESNADRKRLANEIANAAQNKVVVTGIEDEVDIKTFTMSNSEKIYRAYRVCEQGSCQPRARLRVDGRRDAVVRGFHESTPGHFPRPYRSLPSVYRKRHERGDNPPPGGYRVYPRRIGVPVFEPDRDEQRGPHQALFADHGQI